MIQIPQLLILTRLSSYLLHGLGLDKVNKHKILFKKVMYNTPGTQMYMLSMEMVCTVFWQDKLNTQLQKSKWQLLGGN